MPGRWLLRRWQGPGSVGWGFPDMRGRGSCGVPEESLHSWSPPLSGPGPDTQPLNFSELFSRCHIQLCNPMDYSPPGSSVHPGKNTRVGCCALLQGIFPTQGSNPGLPHCRQILYHLSHQGSPPGWSGYPIPSPVDLPNPGVKPTFPALAGGSLLLSHQGNPVLTPERSGPGSQLLRVS